MSCPHSLKYLSQHGRQPHDPELRGEHADGCGMAFSNNRSVEVHRRSRENAWDESYISLAKNVSANIFLAHNRLASKGLEASEKGAHPFSITAKEKTFALCHNGGIRNFMDEAKANGTSDSLIFLRNLIDQSGENDVSAITDRLEKIARETTYSSLTSFLMSADELYVWRIFSEDEVAKESYEKYYTLYMTMRKNAVLFSSEPLDDSPWMLLPNYSLMHLYIKDENIALSYHHILS